jgi:hypothetical protein
MFLGLTAAFASAAHAAWQPAQGPLASRWAKDVSPENALPDYPRPQMVRAQWSNLNGLWDYAITPRESGPPPAFEGQVLVPYPLESALSGVMKRLDERSRLWYRRSFEVPAAWVGQRVLLHFGAVDWEATVIVNGRSLATHRGGYDPFTVDVTDALRGSGPQELVVAVWDPTEEGQPRGKQVRKPGGIMYTPTSGIWQTVWIEPASAARIESLKLTPQFDDSAVTVQINALALGETMTARVEVFEGTEVIQSAQISDQRQGRGPGNAEAISPRISLRVPGARPWTPDSPFLYGLRVTLEADGRPVDTVSSYFGMRKIALGKDSQGVTRILLNNQFVFQVGFLDQGFWPDGLYTAPTDAALRYDLEMTKRLGMNMCRKHVKVEPERWYYWCDRLGLLVWQDMPAGDNRTAEDKQQFERELERMIATHFNHPSIVMWVVFNEGWGQHDTERLTDWVKGLDPSRLVNNASGWTDRNVGDVVDLHNYPGPGSPQPEEKRAAVLGEFGGLGLALPGHTWSKESWGYPGMADRDALTKRYVGLLRKAYELKEKPGLSAVVYTQTTDVETECDGLMTYDRDILKPDLEKVAAAHRGEFPPPPRVTVLVPTSEAQGVTWRYTFYKPADGWERPGFDARAWKEGPGGFGTRGTPGAIVRTEWRTADIWLRREFTLGQVPFGTLGLRMHHDEDVEVYFNGVLAAKVAGYTSAYEEVEVSAAGRAALKAGVNVVAMHCHQTGGGQYIDMGLERVVEAGAGPAGVAGAPGVSVVWTVPAGYRSALYPGNREPLLPSPLIKLPVGSITPRGWLRHMLELEKQGMTGRLKEISPWLRFETSAWANKEGSGQRGWEELPYWLKGFGDLGYVLGDKAITDEARRWIEAVLSSQREDGWFGPRELLASLEGKPDLWPHMVMLNVLQSFFEHTGDARVLPFMTRYFKWQNQLPATAFGVGYWPKIRAGDNIESAHWLYNRTGEAWLLDLARKVHENMARWDKDVINWHNVNIAQGFRAPGVYYVQAREPRLLFAAERNYQKVMGIYGQFPGGGFGGDENCRPGFIDPRQGFETCGIVEFMHSFEMLTKVSGDGVWADRCEESAFNGLPASMTADLKGLHYLTCANQVQLDRHNRSPAIENGGAMFSYSPFEVYRCCQHNVSHGWPYYAEELWLATADHGLCASLYAASRVSARVGDGTAIHIDETTDYPFGETVQFLVSAPRTVAFPLYLRVPRWCEGVRLEVNGQPVEVKANPSSFIVIQRAWADGDNITLQLPMRVTVRSWERNKNAVSVDYGPLSFALRIDERWQRFGANPDWPEWEVFPASAWNYGLELDGQNPAASFQVVRKPGPVPAQPFTPDTAPIELRVKARRIPGWQLDRFNMVGSLQASPARSTEPIETVTLIPMGAARLRISAFPTIGSGPDAHEWVAPPKPRPSLFKPTASHVGGQDTLEALDDGIEPASSSDNSIARFTWWDHRGTSEWAQYDLDKSRQVSSVSVYWFDDTGVGSCRVPQSWRLLQRQGDNWEAVDTTQPYGVQRDGWNKVEFKPVQTTGLRLEVQLAPGYSSGILEWKVTGE